MPSPSTRDRVALATTEPESDEVLTPAEVRARLRISKRQWYRVAPSLPVSYALGKKSPRYVWRHVVAFIERTGAAA